MTLYGPPPPAGDLTERLVPLRPTWSRTAVGDAVESYAAQTAVWAAVQWLTGDETLPIEQLRARRRLQATIRPIDGLTVKWRMRYAGLDWDIVSLRVEGESMILDLAAGVTT